MLSIKVPPLGESIVEATVSRWQKKEGDAVAAGDTLVELETDKITVEVPALKPGVLAKQAKKEGDVVHVDDVLGELDESAVREAEGGKREAESATATKPAQSRPAVAAQPAASSENLKSSPAARRIADERGIPATGTAAISIITSPKSQAKALDLSVPGEVTASFTGVPWYYYECQRATNVTFTGTLQTWSVQAWADGSIYVWDNFAELTDQPPQAFYRLRYVP